MAATRSVAAAPPGSPLGPAGHPDPGLRRGRHRRTEMKKTEILAAAGLGLAALAAVANASETLTYSYDARGRLVRVQHNGSVNANVSTNYVYDKADNRTLKNVTGAP